MTTDQENELTSLISEMGKIYGSAKVCLKNDSANCLSLDPGLNLIMSSSTDYEERTYYWEVVYNIHYTVQASFPKNIISRKLVSRN